MEATSADLRSAEGLEFETRPELFVLLDRLPIVWTVRGIRYFAPRFRRVGIAIASVTTPGRFEVSLRRWDELEWEILVRDIEVRAAADSLAHQCLHAILTGHPGTLEIIDRLEAESQNSDSGPSTG